MSFKTDYIEKSEVATELESILGLIQSNQIGAWDWDLGATSNAVTTEDHQEEENSEPVKYNGWLDKLEELATKLRKTT